MRRNKETLHAFTERAIRATEAGTLMPPIVYLPRSLRRQKMMLTTDNLGLSVDPPTLAENHLKIQAADPVAFLIAIMHGQPIPEFRVTTQGAVEVYYNTPDMVQRIRAAEYLGHKATIRTGAIKGNDNHEKKAHDAMVARAAAAVEEHNGLEETP